MITAKQAGHLTAGQRTDVRYSLATELSVARKYGISVATVRLIRDTACPSHPARQSARQRRLAGQVSKVSVPATRVARPGPNNYVRP